MSSPEANNQLVLYETGSLYKRRRVAHLWHNTCRERKHFWADTRIESLLTMQCRRWNSILAVFGQNTHLCLDFAQGCFACVVRSSSPMK